MSFGYLMGHIMSTSMFMQNFITIFHSVQEIGPFSLFQNLALGKASTNDKCHFATSWTRRRQYQCVCKILSKYSKRFRVIDIFHKQIGDKIFTNCPVTKSNVWLRALYESQPSVSVDFLRVVQLRKLCCVCMYFWRSFSFVYSTCRQRLQNFGRKTSIQAQRLFV